MTNPQIFIVLPRNRVQPGILSVFNIDGLAHTCACKGKADNGKARREGNARRDPARPWGDTPTGDYAPTQIDLFDEHHRSMGRGWIPMEGADGQALQARINGRTGLAIHAGRGDEKIVVTYGCVRVLDKDFDRLVQLIGTDVVEIFIREIG